jgi:glycosyltransferase 2 family protein
VRPPGTATARRGRHAAFFVTTLLVSAVFTYLAVRGIDTAETWHALTTLDYRWLVAATAAFVLSVVVRAWRWRLLFEPARRPALEPTLKALLLGLFFNSILPARAGEAVRIVALRHYAVVPIAESTATVVVERIFDVLSLLFLLFVLAPWLPPLAWLKTAAALGAAFFLVVAAAVVVIVRYGERPIRFVLRPLERVGGTDVDALATSVNRGLAPLRRAGHGLVAAVWSLILWLVTGLSVWLLMLAFAIHLSFLAALLTTVAIGLAFVVPAAPAAIGVFEAAAIASTKAYGVPQSQGLAFALVLHALNFFPYVVAGLVLVMTLPSRGWLRRVQNAS